MINQGLLLIGNGTLRRISYELTSALLATVNLLVEWVEAVFDQVIRVASGAVHMRMNLMPKISG